MDAPDCISNYMALLGICVSCYQCISPRWTTERTDIVYRDKLQVTANHPILNRIDYGKFKLKFKFKLEHESKECI